MFCILIYLVAHFITFGYSQTCFCDLVQSECEVNCCCDPDCSIDDISLFSYCFNINTNVTNLQCVYDKIVFSNLTQTTVQVFQQGLFCLESDRFPERNTFVVPSCAPSNCFDDTVGIFSFASRPNVQNTQNFYRSGDIIYVRATSVANTNYPFSTPSSGFSNACQDNNPIKFLESRTTSCSRALTTATIQDVCVSALNFESYSTNLQILSLPPTSQFSLIPITVVGCIIDGVLQTTCIAATFSSSMCENAVVSASYILTIDGTSGIVSSNVTFSLENINGTNSVTQTFSVMFSSLALNNEAPFSRSGNPGYKVGNPLLSAAREQDTSTEDVTSISQNSIIGVEISILNPSDSGTCEIQSQNRLPILFGVERRTGCHLAIGTNRSCDELSAEIQNLLDGPTFDSFGENGVLFVGTYGNSNIDNLLNFTAADWVQVVRENYPMVITASNGCTLSLSSQYEILYVQTSSISNPQAKILGIRYSYSEPQFLKFMCFASPCNQVREIFTSVTFVDISPAPTSFEREQPDLNARLPSDFFYPVKIP